MAEFSDRVPENAPGPFFVDEGCIDCDLCRQEAPEFFARSEEGGYTYIAHQPATAEEVDRLEEVMSFCPVEAIGRVVDGC